MLFRRNKKSPFEVKFNKEEYIYELKSFSNIPPASRKKLKLCRNMLAIFFPVGIIAGYFVRNLHLVVAVAIAVTLLAQVPYAFYRKRSEVKFSVGRIDLIAVTEVCIVAGIAGGAILLPLAADIVRKYI